MTQLNDSDTPIPAALMVDKFWLAVLGVEGFKKLDYRIYDNKSVVFTIFLSKMSRKISMALSRVENEFCEKCPHWDFDFKHKAYRTYNGIVTFPDSGVPDYDTVK